MCAFSHEHCDNTADDDCKMSAVLSKIDEITVQISRRAVWQPL